MSENGEMMCAELADVAAELALGVLTGRERAMAVAHLDSCDACREDVRQLMATGEHLLELLPPAEPPAGFEISVLARLGLPAPPQEPAPQASEPPQGRARPRQIARHGNSPRHRLPAQGGTRPNGRPSGVAPGSERPRGDQPSGTRRPGWTRRALVAASAALAVLAAGFGGWQVGAATSPAPGQVASYSLRTATDESVGNVFLSSGNPRWLYMAIDMDTRESGNEPVTCQLVSANGKVTTLGTFRIADGYGEWGSPDPGDVTDVTEARIVSAAGTVLASATFPSQWAAPR